MYLELRKIRKAFDAKVAVDDLSLNIERGYIYGIIGPNGAGKTTTIRMVMNITIPDSGEILFDGHPVDESFRDRVGYLPEERGMYKKMTLEEVILYMAQLKDASPADIKGKIDGWLDRVGLDGYRQRKVEELSKGMQQKLQFITTIIHEPDLLILDELFSGLDPLNMEMMKEILLELKRAGTTILFSTHVMEQAEKLCDNLCMISRGKKVIDGRMSEVKAKFGKSSIQIDIEGDGGFIRNLPGVKGFNEFNNYIEIRIDETTDTNLILKEVVNRVTVRRFDIVEPSLYDIFIDMAKVDPSELDQPAGTPHV